MLLFTKHLNIGYADYSVQRDLNLSLDRGSLVCMLGPNGCGKSTLLRTLAGIQRPLSGEVKLTIGTTPTPLLTLSQREIATHIALVLTERESLEKTRVRDIVSMGRYPYTNLRGRLSDEDKKIVDRALEDVGLSELESRYFNSLSDGEKQRILIAKSLTQQTPLILLDEPTAHLDLPNRIKTMLLLRRLAHEQQKSILISTHELDLALQTADIIWLMTPQNGIEVGTPTQLTADESFEKAFADDSFKFVNHDGHLNIEVRPLRCEKLDR